MNLKKIFFREKRRDYRVGLALGGGGTRGFAHLGALKAFEEDGIVFDEVAGTSVGSLVASLYAYGMTSDEMLAIANKLKVSDIRNSRLFFMPSKTEGLEELIKQTVGDTFIEDLKKPLTVVAVDLITGEEIDIKKGNLAKAVAGSCSVPGVFQPVEFENYRLADGGLLNTIPADVLRKNGCKYVVSVDVNPTRGYGTESTKYVDNLLASLRIVMSSNAFKGKINSDVIVEADTRKFRSTRLEGAKEMYQAGYDAAKKLSHKIKLLFDPKFQKIKEKCGFSGKKKQSKKYDKDL